jgi:EmrB/QacA subfamily drug resistance transporter
VTRRESVALWTISVAQLVFLLDATVVNVALPAIQDALDFSGTALTWVVTAYSIPFGGLLLLGGRAGDLLGLRRTLVGGLAVFTAASLLAGLAQEPWQLLACRALQGAGAAFASPAALSLVAATFAEGAPRTRALGTYTAIASIGGPAGLVLGGVLTTYLSWRWVMLVNVPVGLALVAMAPRALPETGRRAGRFDLPGALTGTLAVTLLVYGLIAAAADGTGGSRWGDPAVLGTFAASAAMLVAFLAVERRTAGPLVPLRFFADRQRTGTYAVLVLVSTAMFGVYFFLTLFLQRVWGWSALTTAIVYVPLSLVLMAGARVSSRVIERTGPRALILGGLAAGAVGLAWLSAIDAGGGFLTGMLLPTLLTYAGFGLTSVPTTVTALERVAPQESGLASGLFSTSRQIGGATGLAVLGTVAWAAATGAGGGESGLAVGAGRGFLLAAGVTVLALVVALATVRPRVRDASARP